VSDTRTDAELVAHLADAHEVESWPCCVEALTELARRLSEARDSRTTQFIVESCDRWMVRAETAEAELIKQRRVSEWLAESCIASWRKGLPAGSPANWTTESVLAAAHEAVEGEKP
jgi:hypothetical protein